MPGWSVVRIPVRARTSAASPRESREHDDRTLVSFPHRDEHLIHALRRHDMAEGVRAGRVRSDMSPVERADYRLHALTASTGSPPAVRGVPRCPPG